MLGAVGSPLHRRTLITSAAYILGEFFPTFLLSYNLPIQHVLNQSNLFFLCSSTVILPELTFGLSFCLKSSNISFTILLSFNKQICVLRGQVLRSLKTHFKPGVAYKCVVLSIDGERNLLDLSLTGENSLAHLCFWYASFFRH